jgi:hypothetical protein
MRTSSRELAAWGEYWLLMGDEIFCKTCGSLQTRFLAHEIFAHAPDCLRRYTHAKYPWMDITWILDHLET